MEIKIVTEFGEINLSNINISIQENNSKTSDQQFSKIMLPFEFYATPDFIEKFGDYVSYEASNLKNEIACYLLIENKVHDAKLYIQSIEGYKITAQVDYGFEELPNFDKKLSELPLEKFNVPDIHTYAKDICSKKWPVTNFNFPRIYTDKYSPDSEPWTTFDGYYNDLKPDGSEMRRNYIDDDGNIFNVNVIHPCPHPIYLLKTGFADAGHDLQGDILNDSNLMEKWVFSGTEYFSRLTQRRLGTIITVMDYIERKKLPWFDYPFGIYYREIEIPKPGKYQIIAAIRLETYRSGLGKSWIEIYLNGSLILRRESKSEFNFTFDSEINTTSENAKILIKGVRSFGDGDTEEFVHMDLFSKDLYDNEEPEGEDNGVITNLNKIDLTRAVPEITFGDFVNVIKNWFNYDIEIRNKTVFMNLIGDEEITDVKDYRAMEIPIPKRNLLNKKSFLLKFSELDEGYKKDSMFYDSSGPVLNGSEQKETTIIEINGYLMPLKLPKPGGYNTAVVAKDSADCVALVEYTGLHGMQNNATYSPGCDFPELFGNNWLKWLRQRINGQEYVWSTYCSIEWFSNFSIKNYIFCYNNIHLIKSLNKEKIAENIYRVETTTETVV